MKKLLFFLVTVITLMGSCKKEITEPEVTPAMARDTLYFLMKDVYYWYNLMPSVNRLEYADPYTLLDAMRYKELDRWSFVADYDEFIAEMKGTFVGHGFRIGLDETNKARIAMIYKNAPLYSLGVRRGWIVKEINDVEVAPILLAEDGAAYSELIQPSTEGIINKFLFENPDGAEVTISSAKSSFTINSVILYDTLHLSSGITGHLVFESFIEPSEEELAEAFQYFYNNNVKDLILDLRYNSGGYLTVAQTLSSYIAGNGHTGTAFAKLVYNDKLTYANKTFNFKTTTYPLALQRLFVITSGLTASASEAVINSLTPLLNVYTIGDITNGKPTGMNGWPCGKKYYFWPITFKTVNSLDEGDFFEGFYPDKLTIDDISRDFDNREEECLREAIQYIETGSFSAKGSQDFSRKAQFSEKPEWMNNTFVLRNK